MQEILFKSATQLSKLIARKEISSTELVNLHLAQIEKVNPSLNAVVYQNIDEILTKAKQADALIQKGKSSGKLHGLPISVKDFCDVKDYPSTYGTNALKNNRPTKNTFCLDNLLDEGAIIIGTTNTPELGAAYETDNILYGRTNNPYDLNKTPGGSSGGEAALIAAGGSPFGLGSDAGGSIRVPAHFCGLTGLRPTRGLVSRSGISLMGGGLPQFCPIGTLGPMARWTEDLALMMPILAGYDFSDPSSVNAPMQNMHDVAIDQLKVGYYLGEEAFNIEASVKTVTADVAKFLASEVSAFKSIMLPDLQRAHQLLWEAYFAGGDKGQTVRKGHELLGIKQRSPFLENLVSMIEGVEYTWAGFNERLTEIHQFKLKMHSIMANFDVMLLPVCATPAKAHGTSSANIGDFAFCSAINLLGWPAGVVRCGQDENKLPIGVQVVGRPFADHQVLAVMQALETQFGGYQKPDDM